MSWWIKGTLNGRLTKIGGAVVGCGFISMYRNSRDVVVIDDTLTAPLDFSPPSSVDLPLERSYDVAIIGGGVNGLYVALEAQRRGLSTVLFEGGDIGAGSSGSSPSVLSTFLLHINRAVRMRCPEELIEGWEQLKELRRMTAFLPWGADGVLKQDVGVALPCFSVSNVAEVCTCCSLWWFLALISGPCVSTSDVQQRSAHRPGCVSSEEAVGSYAGFRRWLPFWFISDVGVTSRVNNLGFKNDAPSRPIAPVPSLTGTLATVLEASTSQVEPTAVLYMRFLRVEGYALAHILARQVAYLGGSVRSYTRVETMSQERDGIIVNAQDVNGKAIQTHVKRVVNCCGAWSESLQPDIQSKDKKVALLFDPSPSRTSMYALREDAANRDVDGSGNILQGYQNNIFVHVAEKKQPSDAFPRVTSLLAFENLCSLGAVSKWPWSVRGRDITLVGTSAVGLAKPPVLGAKLTPEETIGRYQTAHAIQQCGALDGAHSPVGATLLGSSAVLSASMAPLSQVARRTFFGDVATNVISVNGQRRWYTVYGGNHLTSRRNAERVGLDLAVQTVKESPERASSINCTEALRPIRLPPLRSFSNVNEQLKEAVDNEFAISLSDVLFRRIGIGFTDPAGAGAAAPSVAAAMAPLRGWSQAETEAEVRRFKAELAENSPRSPTYGE